MALPQQFEVLTMLKEDNTYQDKFRITIFQVLIGAMLISCGESNPVSAILNCPQKVTDIIASPSNDNIIVIVDKGCVMTLPSSHFFIEPLSQQKSILNSDGGKISRYQNIFTLKNGSSAKAKWVSEDEIEVKYWENTEFLNKKTSLADIKINYTLMPDTSLVRKRVLQLCPAILHKITNDIPEIQHENLLPKTFEAEWLSQPTNYHNYIEEYGAGRDYFCNFSDINGGVGWMVFVRIKSINDNFTAEEISPLFVEMRPDEIPEAGKIVWQSSQ